MPCISYSYVHRFIKEIIPKIFRKLIIGTTDVDVLKKHNVKGSDLGMFI